MNIYGPETERCRELQRQLADADQFKALVREYRIVERRYQRWKANGARGAKHAKDIMLRLRSQIDAELRLLESE